MNDTTTCPPLEIRNVFVSSASRDTTRFPNGNNYTVHLTTPIKDVVKVELLHCSVPNSMYNLVDGDNVIAFSNSTTTNSTTPTTAADLTTFSIPPGFYSASGLATTLTSATSNNAGGMSVTYIFDQGKFLFKRPQNPSNSFTMNVLSSSLATMLGTATNTMIPSTVPPAWTAVPNPQILPVFVDNTTYVNQNYIRSTTIADLNPNEGVFLDIHELRTQYNEQGLKIGGTDGTFSGQNMSRSFGMIPMDVSGGFIKRFKKTSDFDFTIDYPYPLQKIDRLTIDWIDKDGRRLDFNGLNDNSFLLRFHTLRRNICSVPR